MIRRTIELGTKVWNENFGFGIFKGWNELTNDAIIKFEFGTISVSRKNLTEIEDEEKQEQVFNQYI